MNFTATTTSVLEHCQVTVIGFETIKIDDEQVDGPCAEMFLRLVEKLEDADNALERALLGLQRDLASALSTLQAGQRVNEIGVVQRQGSEIDRLCGARQAVIDDIVATVFYLRKMGA
jgi:hypothetical protein